MTIDDNEMNALGLLLEELFPTTSSTKSRSSSIQVGPTGLTSHACMNTRILSVLPAGQLLRRSRIHVRFRRRGERRTHEYWKLRRTGAESAHRHQRVRQFYAIYVEETTLTAADIGPELALDEKFSTKKLNGLTPVYPIDGEGVHRVWRYGRETMAKRIAEGSIVARRNPAGGLSLYYRTEKKKTKRYKTVWQEGSHSSAGTAAAVMVDSLVGRPNAFPFPKSLYAVKDAIAAVCRTRKDAVVLDFFGGSGTTPCMPPPF